MNYNFFDSCEDFLKYYFEQGLTTCFELVMEQFEKDPCYLDDNWIKWCAVEYETEDGVVPMAIIGFRQNEEYNSDHISSFEVNISYRSMGFGSLILNEFIEEYCSMPYITLYAEDKNQGFYTKLGFERDPEVGCYFYFKENNFTELI